MNATALIENLRGLGPEALRSEIASREAEIKALRVLLRATREASKSTKHAERGEDRSK